MTTTAMEETNQVSGGVFDEVCAMADRAAEAQRALAKSTTDVKNGLLAAIAATRVPTRSPRRTRST